MYFLFVSNDQLNNGEFYRTEGVRYTDLTTITQNNIFSKRNLLDKTKLLTRETIQENFIARTDNLGTIAIPFDTNGKSVDDKIIFRIKEVNSKNWYYQNTYNANQFQTNITFPFGFPIISNSKDKKYSFQIESLTGKNNNAISLSKTNVYFLTKYKFSKAELINNPQILLQFFVLKINSRLDSLTAEALAFIFLFSLFPFIVYCYRYRKWLMQMINVKILHNRYAIPQELNLKKHIFYTTTLLGVLAFFLSGLITRGNSILNLFITDRTNYFMDFFNVLHSLFNGPYTYGSIYPPLPLLFYRLILRLIPYDIVEKGAITIRASQVGEVVFLFYVVITLLVFFALIMEVKKGLAIEKYIFTFVILLSGPFLFQFERANIIFVALLFLMVFVFFKDSKNRFVRELALISLAIATGIKLYPAIFGLLLLKERRFKDAFKVFIYSLGLLILPFFALGGLHQLPRLVRNIFSTSNYVAEWGAGYAVNIQNITRILFGFFGDFGKSPIVIGRFLSFAVLALGVVSAFFLRSKWKTVAILTLLMILIPSISYEYVLIFMLIPLIMFLDRKEKELFDYIYLACFLLMFIPFSLGKVDSINNGFGRLSLPLTYGVLIQNITASTMAVCLIVEGLLTIKFIKRLSSVFMLTTTKIFATNSKNISERICRFGKFYWFVPIFVILVYNLIFFNRFYPVTEGWFSAYAWLVNHGQFPYRDFYYYLTPFYLIKMSIFTTIFGYSILSLRILGIGVILLMTLFLYKNIKIMFGASIAVFVAIVGMIYYQSGNAHITYDFIQFVTLYGLIQSYLLLKYIKALDTKTSIGIKWVFLAGLFAGLAFLTKQSNGAMITAFSFIGLFLLSVSRSRREILRAPISYITGFITPVIIISLWLLFNSAFVPFIQQVFLGGISAKGGLAQIIFFWIKDILTYDSFLRLTEISLVLVFGYGAYFFTARKLKQKSANWIFLLVTSLVLLLIVFLPLLVNKATVNVLSLLGQQGMITVGQSGMNNVILAAIFVPIVSILIQVCLFILKKPFNKRIFLFSFVALGFIYGTGASAGVSEAGAFAGFCLFIALMLYYRSFFNLGKIFIVLFCISFCLMWVQVKYSNPYYWWNVTTSDVRGELQTTNKIPILSGIYTSADNIKLIEEISAEISSGSKPNQPVLTFPNIPIFYLLSNRKPPGKALVYWFDFLPDKTAMEEADQIRKNPPKVIVYLDLGPSVWEAHERLFRDGKPSGQRKIVEAFMEVIRSKKMHISKYYALPNNVKLTVWRN